MVASVLTIYADILDAQLSPPPPPFYLSRSLSLVPSLTHALPHAFSHALSNLFATPLHYTIEGVRVSRTERIKPDEEANPSAID